MKDIFLCIPANFCESSTYMNFTFARIPVGRYGTSLQTCDQNTLNGMFFSKNFLSLGIRFSMLSDTYHPSN